MWGDLNDDRDNSIQTNAEYLYLAMELCSTNLGKKLTEMAGTRTNWKRKKPHWLWMSEMLMSIAKGLAFLHAKGI